MKNGKDAGDMLKYNDPETLPCIYPYFTFYVRRSDCCWRLEIEGRFQRAEKAIRGVLFTFFNPAFSLPISPFVRVTLVKSVERALFTIFSFRPVSWPVLTSRSLKLMWIITREGATRISAVCDDTAPGRPLTDEWDTIISTCLSRNLEVKTNLWTNRMYGKSIFETALPFEQSFSSINHGLFPILIIQISRLVEVSWTLLSLFRWEKFKFLDNILHFPLWWVMSLCGITAFCWNDV